MQSSDQTEFVELPEEPEAEAPPPETRLPERMARAEDRDREAILARLHEERRALFRKRRTEGLNDFETAYLGDVLQDIDTLELPEARRASEELWQRVEALASRIVAAYEE